MDPHWRSRYEAAINAARLAGKKALTYFGGSSAVEWKADHSPVTVADREAEAVLRRQLLDAFPGDGFLGEESGSADGSSGYRWVVDPIDGTRSFVRGIPIWATLVGLEYAGQQIAGVVYVPAWDQTYRALRGDGAFRDDRPIHVSTVGTLAESDMYYSSLSWFQKAGRERAFVELVRRTRRQRGFGDFYGFVLVAEGAGELMIEHGVHAWDVVAIKPIVEEAGGRFSDWQGQPRVDAPDVVVTNNLTHEETLAVLSGPINEGKR